MSDTARSCVVCGCWAVDLEPHPEFGGALLCRHCWPAHDSGRLDSPPERWQEPDERDKEIKRLREEVRLLSESTYCAYCGEKFPLDNAAAEQVAEHIRTCPKHPMRVPEAEVATLRLWQQEAAKWMRHILQVCCMGEADEEGAADLLREVPHA